MTAYGFFDKDPAWLAADNRPDTTGVASTNSFKWDSATTRLGGRLSRSVLLNARGGLPLPGTYSLNDDLGFSVDMEMDAGTNGAMYFGFFDNTAPTSNYDMLGVYAIQQNTGDLRIRPVIWTGNGRGRQAGLEMQITLSPPAAWGLSVAYAVDDVVREQGKAWICTVAHTSTAATQPGTGADWATVWADLHRTILVADPALPRRLVWNYTALTETIAISVDTVAMEDQVLPAGFKAANASFNRCGGRSVYYHAGVSIDMFFDNLEVRTPGVTENYTFATDPVLDGSGNTSTVDPDLGIIANHDYGYDSATHALKGRINRSDASATASYVAKALAASRTFANRLEARVLEFSLDRLGVDAEMVIGFGDIGGVSSGWPTPFLGCRVGGDTDEPCRGQMVVVSGLGTEQFSDQFPIIYPDGVKHSIKLVFDPGTGIVTLTWEGTDYSMTVAAGIITEGATFTHFFVAPQRVSGGGPLEFSAKKIIFTDR